MANSIQLAEKFLPVLDEIYKVNSLTARMDGQTKPIDFAGAATVKIFKTSTVGLGNYDRNTGYPKGDVTGTWEALTLTASRGREFSVDRMYDEETLAQAFGTLAGEFIHTQVVPEVDAVRFANSQANVSATETQENALMGTGFTKLDEQLNPQTKEIAHINDSQKLPARSGIRTSSRLTLRLSPMKRLL